MHKYTSLVVVLLAVWTTSAPSATAQVTPDTLRITEFMAANASILADEDGDFSDRVEIQNTANVPVNLAGWHLTDDASNLTQWTFPDLVLAPGAYQVVFASGKNRVPQAVFWETVIDRGDTWHYLPGTTEPPAEWPDPGFDDTSWPTGPSGFGYGDDDDATIVDAGLPSLYVRTTFTVTDLNDLQRALLHIDYDDAFVAYVNGAEVARANIGSVGVRPTFDATANGPIEPRLTQGLPPVAYELSNLTALLQTGENTLAIQLHNANATSSDLTLIPFLTFALATPPDNPRGVAEVVAPLLDAEDNIHTNFKLAGNGEYLALVRPDGNTLVTAFDPYPEQVDDISYGLSGSTFGYLDPPTPGGPNSTLLTGFTSAPVFSIEHGFFDIPFLLTLSTDTPGATIRYTTNGSTPTTSIGTRYTEPLLIDSTTVIRAAAFRSGFKDADVQTRTYLFLSDVVAQSTNGRPPAGWPIRWGDNEVDYGMDLDVVGAKGSAQRSEVLEALEAIPSMSLVTDLPHLFSSSTGIYANAWNRGRDWERPASLELIYPDGTDGFQINAGIRIRGGYSRSPQNPKHAFRIFFRAEYGDGKLNYPLFGDEGVASFDNMDLRTSQNYSWSFGGDPTNIMNRDVFSRDLQRDLGMPYTRSRYYHLYLNGQYWGLFQTQERAEASFGESYLGGNKDDYDVIKATPDYNTEATDGNLEAWNTLWSLSNDIADAATEEDRVALYLRAQGLNPDGSRNRTYPVLLDVDNLIYYMLAIFYPGNRDAPVTLSFEGVNNFYVIRDRNGDKGFTSFTHDSEHSLLSVSDNRTLPVPAGNTQTKTNPQWIHQQLTAVAEYRMRFADLAHPLFAEGGALTPQANAERFNSRALEIEKAIVAESARWGDAKRESPLTKQDWSNKINNLLSSYFPERSFAVLNQLKSARRYTDWRSRFTTTPAPLYPSIDAPQFNQSGGDIPSGFELTLSASADTVYYTLDGSDPRLFGGGINPAAVLHDGAALPLNRRTTVKTRAYENGEWSALNETTFFVDATRPTAANLAISEVHYHPHAPSDTERTAGFDDRDDFEFVELLNTGTVAVDLTDVAFTDGITFTFGSTVLAPGARVVIANKEDAFAMRYGTDRNVAGSYGGKLSNSGERLELSAEGMVLHAFSYGDGGVWPGRPDGNGSALELIDPQADYEDPDNWRASSEYGGTPGQAGAGPDRRVVINEVLSHTDEPVVDAIELHNTTDIEIDLSGWYLSDTAVYNKFVIPDGTLIPEGGYLVFDETHFNAKGDTTDFALDGAHGDAVWLVEANEEGDFTRFVDHITFGASANGEAFGRWPDPAGGLYPMAEPTLGAANSGPRVGPVVIREIMYHPVHNDANLEYLVLYNAGSATETLTGWHLTGGVDFAFPDGFALAPEASVLVVPFAPATAPDKLSVFHTTYGFAADLPILGGWAGRLDNGGERLDLMRPDTPPTDEPGFVPQLLEDRVRYDEAAPWPTEADGSGAALVRTDPLAFSDSPENWVTQTRTNAPPEPEPPIQVDTFELSTVFPNPTPHQATFTLAVEAPQTVSIKVYDVLGREVVRLYEGTLEAGQQHRFDFGTSLSSGLYFVRVLGEQFADTRTAVITR